MSSSKYPSQHRYPPELCERAVRMVQQATAESGERFGVVTRVARQLGVGAESLRNWVKQAEIDGGQRPGVTCEERRRITELAWRANWRLTIDRKEVVLGVLTGIGMILVGQSAASWSSQYLAPGMVAVLTATIPLWAALTGWLAFRTRMSLVGSLGLIAGFAVVGFLAWTGAESGIALGPAALVVAGSAAFGAVVMIASRSGPMRRPVVITSLQMLVGGRLQTVVAVATGEAAQVVPDQLLAAIPVLILIVAVPSLVGYTLFTWLLSEALVHIANTGNYVGPVIALGLGWLILGEQVSLRTGAGVAVILVGVALIVWSNRQPRPDAERRPEVAVELKALAA